MTDDGVRVQAGRPRGGGNAALQARVDVLLEGLQQQTRAFAAAQGAVADTTVEAVSPDGSVRVTVDAAGAVVAARIDPVAFGRTTPERLAESFTAAARAAAAEARARVAKLLEPVTAAAADLPDLSDLVPGAPSLTMVPSAMAPRAMVPTVAVAAHPVASGPEPQGSADGDDDLHDWRAPILREAHRG